MAADPENPEFCQQPLGGFGGAKSAELHIFHQHMSFGPRGPHAVSKVLGRCQY